MSQEMELRDQECLTLRAQGQEFAEERQRTEEELASARRALEDERRARMAELNAACQSLSDAHPNWSPQGEDASCEACH